MFEGVFRRWPVVFHAEHFPPVPHLYLYLYAFVLHFFRTKLTSLDISLIFQTCLRQQLLCE